MLQVLKMPKQRNRKVVTGLKSISVNMLQMLKMPKQMYRKVVPSELKSISYNLLLAEMQMTKIEFLSKI